MTGRITATLRAAEAARGLAAAHGPLVLHLSGGCCDGSSPMCLLARELPPGPDDALLTRGRSAFHRSGLRFAPDSRSPAPG
jgi:uncharacterized protein (DUF779 family)